MSRGHYFKARPQTLMTMAAAYVANLTPEQKKAAAQAEDICILCGGEQVDGVCAVCDKEVAA